LMAQHAKMAWRFRAFFTGASVYMEGVFGTGNDARPGCTGVWEGHQAHRQSADRLRRARPAIGDLSPANRSVTESLPGLGTGEDQHMTTIRWTDDFATACQQAGQDQKLVLLDFFSPT
jgi:hypothetical protein